MEQATQCSISKGDYLNKFGQYPNKSKSMLYEHIGPQLLHVIQWNCNGYIQPFQLSASVYSVLFLIYYFKTDEGFHCMHPSLPYTSFFGSNYIVFKMINVCFDMAVTFGLLASKFSMSNSLCYSDRHLESA